jgi:hypothetical protein
MIKGVSNNGTPVVYTRESEPYHLKTTPLLLAAADKQHRTALSLANENGEWEIARLLDKADTKEEAKQP